MRIAVSVRRAKPAALLPLVARACGTRERLRPGRAPAELDQGEIEVGVLGTAGGESECQGASGGVASRFSVISRLYSAYAAARDEKKEASRLQQLRQ